MSLLFFPFFPFFFSSSPWISCLGDGGLGWNKCLTSEIMREGGRCDWRHWEGEGSSSWVVVSLLHLLRMGTEPMSFSLYIQKISSPPLPATASRLPHVLPPESKTQTSGDLKRKLVSPTKVLKWQLLSSHWISYLSVFFLSFKNVLRYLICYCLLFSFLGSWGYALLKFLYFCFKVLVGKRFEPLLCFSISFKPKSFRKIVSKLKSFCFMKKNFNSNSSVVKPRVLY